MRVVGKEFFFVCFICALLMPVISSATTPSSCLKDLRAAFVNKKFPKNDANKCPLTYTVINWRHYQTRNTGIPFEKIMQFVHDHPTWPRLSLLRQRAEEAIADKTPNDTLIKWFSLYPPLTGEGAGFYSKALLAEGKDKEAATIIQEAWRNKSFTQKQLKHFYRQFKPHLHKEDHLQRLYMLGWEANTFGLHGMLGNVSQDFQKLIHTLIALIKHKGNADYHLQRLPKYLVDHPLVIFHRINWRLKKGRHNDAFALFKLCQKEKKYLDNPQAWLRIRKQLARHFLKSKNYQEAYKVCTPHGIDNEKTAVDLEWLSGWLALKLLNKPEDAIKHLERFYAGVETPMSKAKASYWLGYAHEKMNKLPESTKWYEISAQYPLTFFGQMAQVTLPGAMPSITLKVAKPTQPHPLFNGDWQHHENILKLLQEADLSDYAKPFVVHLAHEIEDDQERERLVVATKRYAPQHTVLIAKIAGRKGSLPIKEAYPTLKKGWLPTKVTPELNIPLLNAIIRQESGFNPNGVSPAGARGLMQLMPRTATLVAKSLKLKIGHKEKLLSQPHLNIKLGLSHITQLLHSFEGNLILALASYNAGKGRVMSWIKTYGDPRDPHVDLIDWIELIPFEETRTYIYRILETIPIYEYLHNGKATK